MKYIISLIFLLLMSEPPRGETLGNEKVKPYIVTTQEESALIDMDALSKELRLNNKAYFEKCKKTILLSLNRKVSNLSFKL